MMKQLTMLATLLVTLLASLGLAQDTTSEDVSDTVLLEDLGSELLEASPLEKPPLNDQFVNQLGEDLGASDPSIFNNPMSRVVKHMESARSLLQQSDQSGAASSAQSEALTGLDAMIAELTERKSQCSGGQCDKPGAPQAGKPANATGASGSSPTSSASGTTQSGADLSTDMAVASELVKDLWGQLPQRQREQILQPLSEGFLPKYASEIEAYFRALADPQLRSRTESP